jgi:hypothetical protein
VLLLPAIAAPRALAQEADRPAPSAAVTPGRKLPFLGDLARDRGIELPLPFGVGAVGYYIQREIAVSEVRVGRGGAPPSPVSDFAQFATRSSVGNLNLKLDVWLLPFVNVYAIAGYVWNESETTVDLTLPPLLPSGEPRSRRLTMPTSIEGTVGGLGTTLAGGYGPFFLRARLQRGSGRPRLRRPLQGRRHVAAQRLERPAAQAVAARMGQRHVLGHLRHREGSGPAPTRAWFQRAARRRSRTSLPGRLPRPSPRLRAKGRDTRPCVPCPLHVA